MTSTPETRVYEWDHADAEITFEHPNAPNVIVQAHYLAEGRVFYAEIEIGEGSVTLKIDRSQPGDAARVVIVG